jgi:hypothetical protein
MESLLAPTQSKAIVVKVQIVQKDQYIDVSVLQDSGAEANLIHWKTVQRLWLPSILLDRPVSVTNTNLTPNQQGPLTAYTQFTLWLPSEGDAYHKERISLYIIDTGPHNIILGTPWLELHNPNVDWRNNTVSVTRCPSTCNLVNQLSTLRNFRKQTPRPSVKDTDNSRTLSATFLTPKDNGALQLNHLFVPDNNSGNNVRDNEETPALPVRPITTAWVLKAVKLAHVVPNIESCTLDISDAVLYTDKYTEDDNDTIAIRARFTKLQELAEAAFAATKQKAYDKIVPEAYRDFNDVFSKEASKQKPKFGLFDHTIDLKPGFKLKPCKLYPLSPSEQVALDAWPEEHLKKGYIRPSKSSMASPFFFVKKKDGSLRPIQDYWYLNSGTIKNTYPLPLIGKLIDQLKGSRIFFKFDIRWGYPNVCIKEGDKWKPVFCTNRGLFKPLVMFFGLTNSPATFQSMMNKIFKKLIAEGHIVVYMDDILVFTSNLEHHRQVVREVLEILRQNDLYLKATKCAFEQTKIEFLRMIIEHNSLSMDPIKVDRILFWPRPRNVTNVQALAGFTGFY